MTVPGTVYRSDSVTVLDTREMRWERSGGLDGSSVKTLARLPGGEDEVTLLWRPPGPTQSLDHLPYRHYHRSVRECLLVLSDELPYVEYESPEQRLGEGTPITLKAGYFVDRRPGSGGLHGLEPGMGSPVGATILHWRTGPGNLIGDPGFASESVEVPYP
ncbi:MAG: hypothetical protein FJW96_10990 [Actinobacteria bacterium]|nr:hypothetical protein [Actinomycetota bacterium]